MSLAGSLAPYLCVVLVCTRNFTTRVTRFTFYSPAAISLLSERCSLTRSFLCSANNMTTVSISVIIIPPFCSVFFFSPGTHRHVQVLLLLWNGSERLREIAVWPRIYRTKRFFVSHYLFWSCCPRSAAGSHLPGYCTQCTYYARRAYSSCK